MQIQIKSRSGSSGLNKALLDVGWSMIELNWLLGLAGVCTLLSAILVTNKAEKTKQRGKKDEATNDRQNFINP